MLCYFYTLQEKERMECSVSFIVGEMSHSVCLFAPQEKRLACEQYTEIREELSGIKGRSEREIQSLKEHLRLAMAALQEGQKLGNSLDHWEAAAGYQDSGRHSERWGLMLSSKPRRYSLYGGFNGDARLLCVFLQRGDWIKDV